MNKQISPGEKTGEGLGGVGAQTWLVVVMTKPHSGISGWGLIFIKRCLGLNFMQSLWLYLILSGACA